MEIILSILLFIQAARPVAPEYVVGAQDRLKITVFNSGFEEPQLSKTITIDGDGTFEFPLIGRVKAAGMTVRQIEGDLKTRLGPPSGFLVSPQVTIEVETYRSQVVYVQGEVRAPGYVPLKGTMTVMDALAQAGSPTPSAGSYVELYRRPPGQQADGPLTSRAGAPAVRITMDDLRSGRAQDLLLADGDTINVPKAQTFIVNGHVRTPGPYVLDGEVTVEKALAMAGGVTDRGAKGRTKITRYINGKTIELKNVKMTDLVQPNDTIYVPQRFF